MAITHPRLLHLLLQNISEAFVPVLETPFAGFPVPDRQAAAYLH